MKKSELTDSKKSEEKSTSPLMKSHFQMDFKAEITVCSIFGSSLGICFHMHASMYEGHENETKKSGNNVEWAWTWED